ncbi:LLM class flavin-dependent oxidoreductase [Streptomyces sp. NBC_01450]|uniref:LLM class flavin-dependent oxidoreductase n=1 Tax=Streptomyces sp. NBC_01450 TaxID=2903871 RepID=UPI002E311A4D|nr:LLM class flavin-dependent oxidoreductase [Streptomyces sp. NBC_01450]
MEFGILSLSDLQTDPATGAQHDAARRIREIMSYVVAADRAGLDAFGLAEHHSPDFAVANPAVIDLKNYDDVFTEKLRLLLAIRENPAQVTWSGRFRPALDCLPDPPRPLRPNCLCGSASEALPPAWNAPGISVCPWFSAS